MPTKRAVLFGCNYPGQKGELQGCINDVFTMLKIIKAKGFQDEHIKIMIDTDEKYEKPTGANMRKALAQLVEEAQEGDILFVHYSGHGTQVPCMSEKDWKNEALVPTDMNLLVDDDLKDIFSKLKPGIDLTFVADCCHSGGMLDHEEVLIQGDKKGDADGNREVAPDAKNRALSIEQIAEAMSQMFGKPVKSDGESVRRALGDHFGGDASKFALDALKFIEAEMHKKNQGQRAGGGLFGKLMKMAKDFVEERMKPPAVNKDVGVLITGCQSTETSADVRAGGTAYGALTNTLSTVLQENPNMTYKEAVLKTRHKLYQKGYTQNPCLECSEANANKPFICHA